MAERRTSLRGRLVALLVAASGIVWVAVAVATFIDARHQADLLFDAQLTEYSEVLTAIAGHEVYEIEGKVTVIEHEYAQALTYQVWSTTNDLLMRSHAAPATVLATADGFSDVEVAGARWRAHRRVDRENALVLIVAHRFEVREELAGRIAWRLALPVVVGLPLLALAIALAVWRALAPLERLTAEIRGRDPQRLEPVVAPEAPSEVVPLIEALNQLFARLERSFENERRFTGDAAHELRTPLAALRTQAEVALTTESDERRRRALGQVVAGVDRATRLVAQLLALARLDGQRGAAAGATDLGAIAREALAELAAEAEERQVALEFAESGEGPREVRGESAMLHALVRNLAENAVRYTPPGGRARVLVRRAGDEVVLAVEDSGPGVPEEFRARIFDRFFRMAGESAGGSGLGLSIARRVVELHSGSIAAAASPELGGLAVTVRFPAADKDALRKRP